MTYKNELPDSVDEAMSRMIDKLPEGWAIDYESNEFIIYDTMGMIAGLFDYSWEAEEWVNARFDGE